MKTGMKDRQIKDRQMKERQIKDALQCRECSTDLEKMRLVCSMIEEIGEEKRKRRRIGFLAFLRRQMRFIYWKIWFVQGGMLFFLYGIFMLLFDNFWAMRQASFFLCCVSILIMFSAVPILYRSTRYTMYEVELASRFSMIKLLVAKLLAIGIGNMVLLGTVLFLTVLKTTLQIESALLYIIVSYLAAAGSFLYLLGHIPAEKMQAGSIGLGCALFFLLICLKEFCPAFFAQTFSAGWIAVSFMLFLFCIRQFHYLVCCSAYAKASI